MEDEQEVILIEDEVLVEDPSEEQAEEPVQQNRQPEPEPEPVPEPPRQAPVQQQPYQQANPLETLKEPNEADYDTWDEYFKANNAYRDARERILIDQAVARATETVQRAYDPIIGATASSSMAAQIANRYQLPPEARSYVESQLKGVPPSALANLDASAQEILADAAIGQAIRKGVYKPQASKVPIAEPVAGVGPQKVRLAEGVSKGELDAYLNLTGKRLDKATVEELRREGYLK